MLQLRHFTWCCGGQEALNGWMETLSIAMLIKCAVKRIPFPFPAPAHPPVSPSPFSVEPSHLTETQQDQALGKTVTFLKEPAYFACLCYKVSAQRQRWALKFSQNHPHISTLSSKVPTSLKHNSVHPCGVGDDKEEQQQA